MSVIGRFRSCAAELVFKDLSVVCGLETRASVHPSPPHLPPFALKMKFSTADGSTGSSVTVPFINKVSVQRVGFALLV